jgi:hypothetical protein
MLRRLLPLIAVAFASAPMLASAQHTDFTLFGTPNKAGQDLPAERKAVHPISAPYFHEDSFITTDVRAWYAYHSFPDNIALAGGDASVYAAQIRVALSDRFQLVAYKDGYTDFDSGLIKDSGFNDVAAGIKYAIIQDYETDFHVSAGLGYQFALGDPGAIENTQEARGWVSVNKGFDRLHLGATLNYLKFTGNQSPLGNSDRFMFHVHADYYVCKWFSPVLEFNGYYSTNDGNEVVKFSGADVKNLGGGSDLITAALGFEVRPIDNLAARIAYETDLTSGESLFGYRWTFSLVYSF